MMACCGKYSVGLCVGMLVSRWLMWRCEDHQLIPTESDWGLIELQSSVFDLRDHQKAGLLPLSQQVITALIITKLTDHTVSKLSPAPAWHLPSCESQLLLLPYYDYQLHSTYMECSHLEFFTRFLIYYKEIYFLKPEDLKRKYFELFKSFISFQQTELWSNYTNFKELQFSSRHFHSGWVF